MDEIAAVFQALWNRASQHARVMYNDPGWIRERGGFETRTGTGNKPLISLCEDADRKTPQKPCWETNSGKLLSETERLRDLITLAHEYGHLVSYLDGTRSPEYEAAWRRVELSEPRLEGDVDLVVAEETRAWSHGRDVLRAMGFTRWDEFDRREVDGIDLYRRSFATI